MTTSRGGDGVFADGRLGWKVYQRPIVWEHGIEAMAMRFTPLPELKSPRLLGCGESELVKERAIPFSGRVE